MLQIREKKFCPQNIGSYGVDPQKKTRQEFNCPFKVRKPIYLNMYRYMWSDREPGLQGRKAEGLLGCLNIGVGLPKDSALSRSSYSTYRSLYSM